MYLAICWPLNFWYLRRLRFVEHRDEHYMGFHVKANF